MSIHKEGFATISITLIFLLLINVVQQYFLPYRIAEVLVALFSIFLFVVVLQFFRKPTRIADIVDGNIIAPCDGKVVVIENVYEPEYLKREVKQISIFMSPINVHINWAPVTGLITYFKYHPGKYLVAWHPKSSTENERTTTVFKTKNGDEILVRQIAGALARRIVNYCKEGSAIGQGNEMGFIKFGSRVDVYLPLDAEVKVQLEQKSIGNKTILATLKTP
jgi:phosphatidylserine decarboxylase